MATLELAIDATKAQQGAQVAQQAFTQVQKAAEGAARSVQVSSQAVSAAFQATGGTVQVAGGITATAKALTDLNAAAASSNAARLLLEIGKTAQDFKEVAAGVKNVSTTFDVYGNKVTTVTQATGRFGTVFATLNGIIKANPLLAAVTAISAIGTALTLFTSETKKATDAYEEFGAALQKQRISAQAAQYLGIAGPGPQGTLTALQGVAERQVLPGAAPMNLQQFGQLGYGATAARYLAQQGTPEQQRMALEYMRTGGYQSPTYAYGAMGTRTQVGTQFQQGLPQIQLDAAQTQAILRGIYQSIQQEAPAAAAATNVYQFGAAETPQQFPTIGLPGGALATAGYQYDGGRLRPQYQVEPGQAPPLVARPDRVTMTGTGGTAFMASQALENAVVTAAAIAQYKKQEEEAARRIAENFQRAADYAGQVGGSLGSAFADVLMKTTTLRQAFASIVSSFARQGLADIGASIFRGAVSGLTPTQATNNLPAKT